MIEEITKDKGGFKSRPVHHKRTPNISEKIFNVLWQLKKDGYAEETIKGKNVDDRDLEKMANLIQQANERSSKVNLKGLFKSLKKSRPYNSQRQ